MPEPLALKDHSGESQIYYERVAIAFGVVVVLTLLLMLRMVYLQVVQHDLYATLSDKNRIEVRSVPPIRGLIYDRNGDLIADNVPSKNLNLVIERVRDLEATLAALDQIIDLDDDEVAAFRKRLTRSRRPFESVPLRFGLTEEEDASLSVNRHVLRGIEVEGRLVRHYPKGSLMAHAVGSVRRINEADLRAMDRATRVAYSGIDHVGKIGVERHYEPVLLGGVGHQRVETNARGRVMGAPLEEIKPTPGLDLTLHVDSELQQVASDALGDRRGAVVGIDPKTGGILVMVSKPSYDPNLFVAGIGHAAYASMRDSPDVPLFNRALQGQYEPGSTVKPFIGLIGLIAGAVSPEYTIEDPGYFRLPGQQRLYRDWNWRKDGRGGHGRVNFEKAIYRSCNVYFYQLVARMGIDRIAEGLTPFGFGSDLSLDLPEARRGLMPTRDWKRAVRGEPWYPGDTVNIGIGQGDMLVTPLQLATAVAALANRGRVVQPRMLRTGAEVLPREGVSNVDGVPEAVWELVIGSMAKVVHRGSMGFGENGTAWAYIGRGVPYRMAGKSGTAQVVGIRQGEEYDAEELTERQRKHAWFIAFAPLDDPQIALAVLVENGGGGSQFAAPVARQILDHHLGFDTGFKAVVAGR